MWLIVCVQSCRQEKQLGCAVIQARSNSFEDVVNLENWSLDILEVEPAEFEF